jgi:hypothetical protein
MIDKYIKSLVASLPLKKKDDKEDKNKELDKELDIILDGGLFNGSYLAGALLFIKELEVQGTIKVMRISGCSVGSIAALLYHINVVNLSEKIYTILLDTVKKTYQFDAFDSIFKLLEPFITDEVCKSMTKRVYITYYNVITGKQIVKYKYKNSKDVFRTVKRSCFVPFLIDGNLVYQKKYMDGMNPYIFPIHKYNRCRKVIYMDLLGYGKLFNIISVKNEISNFHRILAGALDIHFYYLRGESTSMCSCVNNWTIFEYIYYIYIRKLVERILYHFIYLFYVIQEIGIESNMVSLSIKNVYILFVKNYCL